MRLTLNNPFYKKNKFKNLFSRYFHLYGNKYFEFELIKDNYYWFETEFSWTTKRDHAGIRISFGIFGYLISFNIYDKRHWDYNNNCWKI